MQHRAHARRTLITWSQTLRRGAGDRRRPSPNLSPWLDFYIMLRTARAMLTGQGAQSNLSLSAADASSGI